MGRKGLLQNLRAEDEANAIGARFANSNNVVADMSKAYGYDFSNVKLHDDDASDSYVRSTGKDAVANGNDIFFGKGMLSGKDPAQNALVGHELTHIMQQASFGGVSESVEAGASQGGLLSFFRRLFSGKKKSSATGEAETKQMQDELTQIRKEDDSLLEEDRYEDEERLDDEDDNKSIRLDDSFMSSGFKMMGYEGGQFAGSEGYDDEELEREEEESIPILKPNPSPVSNLGDTKKQPEASKKSFFGNIFSKAGGFFKKLFSRKK